MECYAWLMVLLLIVMSLSRCSGGGGGGSGAANPSYQAPADNTVDVVQAQKPLLERLDRAQADYARLAHERDEGRSLTTILVIVLTLMSAALAGTFIVLLRARRRACPRR